MNLTAKQGPDSLVYLRYICNFWKEMPNLQETVLATQARYVLLLSSTVCFDTSTEKSLQTERRQRSSDSLEQQQRQPKQFKIDIAQLPQQFKKLMLSTTGTTSRGIAVENTLPRFCPERVFYSGCVPLLEG